MFENIKGLFNKSSDSVTWVFGNNSERKDFKFTDSKGISFYQKSLFLNRAINKRAEKVGGISFELKDLKGNIVENEYSKLLAKPNDNQTKTQFFRLLQKYMDIYGAFYILKVQGETKLFNKKNVPEKLILLNPKHITLLTDSNDEVILGFKYSNGSTTTTYSLDEVIYNNNPNPVNPILPESLIYSGIRALETNINADEYQANSLATGGKLDTIIQAKGVINAGQLEEMKASYRKSKKESFDVTGGQEPFFAGGDIDVKRLSMSSKDLEYVNTKKMSIDDISILTSVPIEILGVTSGSTYANADASIRIFIRETIKPLQKEIQDVLNWRLIPDEYNLSIIDPVPYDMEEKRKDLETADRIHAMTINEKREALGLPEIKGGDDILVPFNLTPLTGEEKQPEKAGKKKLKKYSDEFKLSFVKMYEKKLDNRSGAVKKFIVKYFQEQEQRVLSHLEGQKINAGEIFNLNTEKDILSAGITNVLKSLFIEQGKEHLLLLGDIAYSYTSNAQEIIKQRAEFMADKVNETTYSKIQKELSESIAGDETRKQLVDRLKGKYDEFTVGRSETIARTETHNILQRATLDASKQNGNTIKTWIWSPGVKGGVRDSHVAMDGVDIPIDDSFKLPSGATAQTPGSTGDAGEDINCQCTMI